MKTKSFLILFISILLCIDNVSAQYYTIEELSEMYKKGQCDRAIPYLQEYVEANNAEAMVLLGDCIRQKASDNLKKVNKETGADLALDNPYAFANKMLNSSAAERSRDQALQSQAMTAVNNADLQALHLYLAASRLGNVNADNRLRMLSMIYPGTTSSTGGYSGTNNNAQNSSSSQSGKCGFCNGTGVNPTATSVPAYGSTSQHWCEVCKTNVSASHGAHLSCPSCGGKGYK